MSVSNKSLVVDVGTASEPANTTKALAAQEHTIHTACGRFGHDVGGALLTIREQGLYSAAGFDRFEDYCQERWSFSRQRAHQLIEFFRVVLDISRVPTSVDTRGMPLPRLEAQIRPLIRLKSPEKQRAAWENAVNRHGERATQAQVDDAGTTAIGEIDIDWPDKEHPDPVALAGATGRLRRALDAAGIPHLATVSGRRGFHLAVFDDTGVIVESFPKDGSAKDGDTKLSCGIHRATGEPAAPVGVDLRPLPREQWADALRAVGDADPAALAALATESPPDATDAAPATAGERHIEEQFATLLGLCPRMGEILDDLRRPYTQWTAALHAASRFSGDAPRRWAGEMTARYFDGSETTRRRDRKAIERAFADRSPVPTCRSLGCPGAGKRCCFAKKGGREPTPLRHLAKREMRRSIRVDPDVHPPVPQNVQRVEAAREEMAAGMHAFFADPQNDGRVLPVLVPPGTGKTTVLRADRLLDGGRLDIVTARHQPFEEEWEAWAQHRFRHIYGRNETNCRSFVVYRQHRARGQRYCPEGCPHQHGCLAGEGGYLGQFVGLDALAGTIATLPHWREGRVPGSRFLAFDDVAVQDLVERVSLSRAPLTALAEDATLTDGDHRCALLLRDALTGVGGDEVFDHFRHVAGRNGWQPTEGLRRVSARSYELRRMAEALRRHQRASRQRPDTVSPVSLSADAIAAYLPPHWPAAMRGQRVAMLGASLDVGLLRAVLPADLALAEPLTAAVAWDRNVRVVQYADRWLGATDARAMLGQGNPETVARKRALLDRIVAAIHRHADELCVDRRDIGVITFKEMEAELAARVGTDRSAHFGAVTSSNALEHVPLLAVVGTYQPPLEDVQRRAAALWPDLRQDEVASVHRFVPFPGTDLSARAIGFVGERPQLLLRALREEELYQAVHRLRPHLPDVAARRILIFSSLPIPRIPAEVHFLDAETDDRVAYVRAGAAALRALSTDKRVPAKAEVLRRMGAGGHIIGRDHLARIWEEILHAAGGTPHEGGADARGRIIDSVPPTRRPPALRGLADANARREEAAYRAALRAIEALDATGTPATGASVARQIGISEPNRGVRRAIEERAAAATRISA